MSSTLDVQPEGIPLPNPSKASGPYWAAARDGRLVFQRCRSCGVIPARPVLRCGECGAGDLEWVDSGGRGTLYSWTVVWRPQHPSFRTPYAPGIVRLDEGWYLMTAMVGCEPEDLEADLAVQIEFHPAGGDIWLPYARPVTGGAG